MYDYDFTQLSSQLINAQRERLGLPSFTLKPIDMKRLLWDSKAREKDIKRQQAELEKELSCYSHNDYRPHMNGPGGKHIVKVVERELEHRGRVEAKLERLERELEKMHRAIDCLQILPPDSRKLIERLYLQRESHVKILMDVNASERTLKRWVHNSLLLVWLAFATDWRPPLNQK